MNFKLLLKLIPLILIGLLALSLRLYKIDSPVLDWHSFRQADTASVTREYVKNGVDLLHPKYHDLSNIQSGQDNPEGYRMVEFPIINGLLATIIRTFPNLDLVTLSRFSSVLASLITLAAIYYLGYTWSGKTVGVIAAIVFATLPFAIYYSRAILPEPYLLATSTTAIACFQYWLITKRCWSYVLTFLLLGLSFLLKPFAVFLAPVFLGLLIAERNNLKLLQWLAIAGLSLSIVPLFLWRDWIQNFPTGIPVSDWLYNGNGIRLRPAWFRWLIWERVTKLFLGYTSIVFLPLSIIYPKNKELLVYSCWWGGIVAFMIVFATGNVQHDYYQNLMLPVLALSLGRGMTILARALSKKLLPLLSWVIVIILYLVGVSISWMQVRGFYNINHWEYQRVGKVADELLPADALVIAPAMGDTMFLYQTNRRGWPLGFDIDQKISAGATHYVTTSKDDEANELKAKYTIIKESDEYVIIDLTKKKS